MDIKENRVGATSISAYDYAVNNLNQRDGVATSGSAFTSASSVAWGYDALGQVVAADEASGSTSDFGYECDKIGNRKKSSRGTINVQASSGAMRATYRSGTAATSPQGGNNLNQYVRLDFYGATTILNNTHDDDGNQIEGRFPTTPSTSTQAGNVRAYDGENQLISTTINSGTPTLYTFDAYHRRVAKRTSTTDATYTCYDAWNPVADYTRPAATFILQTSFTWGTDLSRSMQGAGGVGGLLAVQKYTGTTGIYLPTYDGNGNVSEYLNTTGAIVAHYEYGPFGEQTVAIGSQAADFKHRFSTKPLDAESGYYYYGYRSYDPLSGRWMGRDPIGERGGVNLYGMVGNMPPGNLDILGQIGGTNYGGGFGVDSGQYPGPARSSPTPSQSKYPFEDMGSDLDRRVLHSKSGETLNESIATADISNIIGRGGEEIDYNPSAFQQKTWSSLCSTGKYLDEWDAGANTPHMTIGRIGVHIKLTANVTSRDGDKITFDMELEVSSPNGDDFDFNAWGAGGLVRNTANALGAFLQQVGYIPEKIHINLSGSEKKTSKNLTKCCSDGQ